MGNDCAKNTDTGKRFKCYLFDITYMEINPMLMIRNPVEVKKEVRGLLSPNLTTLTTKKTLFNDVTHHLHPHQCILSQHL